MKKILILTITSLLIFSCSSKDDGAIEQETPPNAVRLASNAQFGSILTNSDGFSLYFFAPDAKGQASCLGDCENVWPAFLADELTLDDGLDATDFGTITTADGKTQTTYKGWPLYAFSNDAQPGDVNGDNTGGVWFVAKPDYSFMLVRSQLVGRDTNGVETNLNSAYEIGNEETFYITDDRGNTLYRFSNDTNDQNNFTNPDFSNNSVWPIYNKVVQRVATGMNAAEFGSIDVFGEPQLTYRGWPLYKFGGDENRGDNFGVGFPQSGVWPIVNFETEIAPEDVVDPKERVFEVSNVGASAYKFEFTAVQNPDIELKRGKTYEFNVDAPGHPFIIKSVQGTGTDNAFNDGVTNNGIAQGIISFTVPQNAPDTLFYNCEFHGSMTGVIRIVD